MFTRRRSRSNPVSWKLIAAIVAVLTVAGAGVWWSLRPPAEAALDTPGASDAMATSIDSTAAASDVGFPPLDLPDLPESDEFVRDIVSTLSSHPRLASWLITDELVHTFVGTVVDLAGGRSPRERIDFLVPEGTMRAQQQGGQSVVDPTSYARYEPLVTTFTSLDTEGTARLYHQLHPLFEEAFAELGIPEWTFDDTFRRATDNLLAVSVPDGPVQVQEDRASLVYVDPALESLTEAEKHLLRLGPENARAMQAKLREILDAIGE